MTYQESIDWLYSTQTFGIKLGLDGPRRLLREYLAFPPRRTKVIHVAGTNGKGSVCTLIDSVARATGVRTGLFTSPHLVHYRERVRVSGQEISEDEIARHLTSLRDLVADWEHHPTFFEITLALALKHFNERSCELLILETGMGGRLDATTAVPADIAVLTPVSLDHQQWLGDTLTEIAGEKAAIICRDKPVFSSPQEPEAATVIAQTANERRAPLEVVDEPLLGYAVGIPGEHQKHNAGLALAALHATGAMLSYETVKVGLRTARHPGRFEIIDRDGSHLVFDIAHNPAAAAALAQTWNQRFGDRQARLVFGVVATKDLHGIFHHLAPIAAEIHLVPVNSPRAVPPEEARAALPDNAPPVTIHSDLHAALTPCPHRTPTLVTGSAFLVGQAKAILENQHHRASEQ